MLSPQISDTFKETISLFYLGFLVFFGWNSGLTQTVPSHGEAETINYHAFVENIYVSIHMCIQINMTFIFLFIYFFRYLKYNFILILNEKEFGLIKITFNPN